MKRTMRVLLSGIAAVFCAATVQASLGSLLGVSLGTTYPRTSYLSSVTSYNAGTRVLSINGPVASTQFTSSTPPRSHSGSVAYPNNLSINVKVLDANANSVASVGACDGATGAGCDFVMTGSINGTTIGPGVLLTGKIIDLGAINNLMSGSTTDHMDIRFHVMGGLLSSFYANKDIGVIVTLESSTWGNNLDFDSSFSSPVTKGNVVPVAFSSCNGEIGDFVWRDELHNGIQDPSEPGIENARVVLTLADNSTTSTVTNSAGAYFFKGLCDGTYSVQVDPLTVPPSIYSPAAANQGIDDSKDSDSVGGAPVSVTLGGGNPTVTHDVDFGYEVVCSGTVGNFVWFDANGNSVQDPSELGLNSVQVTLTGNDIYGNSIGPLVAITTNDPNPPNAPGFYQFTGLCQGSYTVTVNQSTLPGSPGSFMPSPPNPGTGTNNNRDPNGETVVLGDDAGIDFDIDFGFDSDNPCTGMIGNFVWLDLNQDGYQDPGEPGINGVAVTLTGTDFANNSVGPIMMVTMTNGGSKGYYQFPHLCAGSYEISVDTGASSQLHGLTQSTSYCGPGAPGCDETTDSNDNPQAGVSLVAPPDNPFEPTSDITIDFGFHCTATIGNFVWDDLNGDGKQDGSEPGLDGLTLTLTGTDVFGNPVGPLTTTTAGGGAYEFGRLCAGGYTVSIPTPPGYIPTPSACSGPASGCDSTNDSDGSPASVALTHSDATGSNDTLDFGYWHAGSIGDRVWYDADGDGVQDVGEGGIYGWSVTIGGADLPVGYFSTTTTDGNGIYHFTNLPAGTYTVCVGSAQTAGYTQTYDLDGLGTPHCATRAIGTGANAIDVDFGYRMPPACLAAQTSITSGFNGTSISTSSWIWFNSNLKANNIPSGTKTTISFRNSTITITPKGSSTGTIYLVPDALITFDPAASCGRTSFNSAFNRWETVLPTSGSDEIFLAGFSLQPTVELKAAQVAWAGEFASDQPNVSLSWKWSAAVYATDMSDYSSLGVKAVHSNVIDCNFPSASSHHAGTPENKKAYVKGGARGGGGSNFTGSWSGTASVNPCLQQPTSPPTVACAAGTATQGASYSSALTASGGVPPYQYSILDGGLPPGLALNGGGAIIGTPTTAGTYNYTVAIVGSSTTDCQISVSQPPPPGP